MKTVQNLLSFARIVCILAGTSVTYSMQKTISTEARQLVESIQPVSPHCIQDIPWIFYANPTPYQFYHWNSEQFNLRKNYADKATKAALAKLTPNADKLTYIKEMYDWIDALSLAESFLRGASPSTITIQRIIDINRRVARLTEDSPGRFREKPAHMHKRKLSIAETLFANYLLVEHKYSHELPEDIKSMLRGMNAPLAIDLTEVDAWESESRLSSEYRAGMIDCAYWLNTRIHTFSRPEDIDRFLTQALHNMNRPGMTPIEAAARIWIDIIRIHPFNTANKRTARMIASMLLFSRGYLAPIFRPNLHADAYKQLVIMNASLENEHEYDAFVQFIAQLVKDTQKEYPNPQSIPFFEKA